MRYQRVIVDGFSLLHRDDELRPLLDGQPALARHQLVRKAEAYGLLLGDAVTVVFDGRRGLNDAFTGFQAEVIFSPPHLSADGVIERMVAAAPEPGRLLVITSDRIERETVGAAGAESLSCGDFLDQGRRSDRARARPSLPRAVHRPARLGDFFPPDRAKTP